MTLKLYKWACVTLTCLAMACAWGYWSLWQQVLTVGFISNQARHVTDEIRFAEQRSPARSDKSEVSDRDLVLTRLKWYIEYYDQCTNYLSPRVEWVARTERYYVVRDAIQYLRRTSTNDFGEDPYAWLKHEY